MADPGSWCRLDDPPKKLDRREDLALMGSLLSPLVSGDDPCVLSLSAAIAAAAAFPKKTPVKEERRCGRPPPPPAGCVAIRGAGRERPRREGLAAAGGEARPADSARGTVALEGIAGNDGNGAVLGSAVGKG